MTKDDALDLINPLREPGWRALLRFVEEHFPEDYRAFYPRTFENLGKFYSPKIAACMMANNFHYAARLGLQNIGAAARNQAIVALMNLEHDVPLFFVPTKILKALEMTNPPDDLDWTTLEMPHPGMTFIFEQGAVTHPSDGPIAFLAFGRLQTGQQFKHPRLQQFNSVRVPVGGFLTMSGGHETPGYHTYDMSMGETSAHDLGSVKRVSQYDMRDRSHSYDLELSEDDKDFNKWMVLTAIKLILLMTARPEMVSVGQRLRTVKVKRPSEKPKEFWSPNIIGKSYSVGSPPNDGTQQAGEGNGKRMHWRRGHFTQQAHGPQRSLRKTLWLEPMLVGGKET